VAAEGVQGGQEGALPGRGDAGGIGQEAGRPAGLAEVAADLGDSQPRGKRDGLVGPGHRRAVHDQPGHGLAVGVEQPGDGDGAGRGGHRQQGPRTGQLEDLVPDRPGRQVLGQPGPAGPPTFDGLLGLENLVPAEQQTAAPPGVLVFEHQPGAVQPPVEGVQPGMLARAAAGGARFGGDAERLSEPVQNGRYRVGRSDISV